MDERPSEKTRIEAIIQRMFAALPFVVLIFAAGFFLGWYLGRARTAIEEMTRDFDKGRAHQECLREVHRLAGELDRLKLDAGMSPLRSELE